MMSTRWLRFLSFLLATGILAGCLANPSPADVASERARWSKVRDVTADGQISNAEVQELGKLLDEWDAKLVTDEAAAGRKRDAATILGEIVRVYGPAAVQVALGDALQTRPEWVPLFRLVDKNSDGFIDGAELASVDPLDPVFALVVATTARALLTRGH